MSVTDETEKIYSRLKRKVSHSYVETILHQPVVDRDKLMVYYLLFQTHRDRSRAAELAMDLMTAEIGLSTHEQMTNASCENKVQMKQRQLVVLSGDYYSSLYYFSLAQNHEIEIARWVSEAIQRYNISKCALFYPEGPLEWQQAMEHLLAIDGALTSYIAAKLGLEHWESLLKDLFFARRLYHESGAGEQPTRLGSFFMDRFLYDASGLRDKFRMELEKVKKRFDQLIGKYEWESTEACTLLLSYLKHQMQHYSLR